MSIEIIHADSRKYLKKLEDNSVDSIVTDPPYELGFMGKDWDRSGIAYDVKLWEQCLRILKPGGHLLAFGGTRTYHRMVCAIEDAGFEIRDQIQWIYGSGFPKSYNIGKTVDKLQGNDRKVVGINMIGGGGASTGGNYAFGSANENIGKNGLEITRGNSEWEGWGTALKPANEPICLARKPISEKNITENILKWGTGAINIDACRIMSAKGNGVWGSSNENCKPSFCDSGTVHIYRSRQHQDGRFPANVILDEAAGQMLDEQAPETGAVAPVRKGMLNPKTTNIYGEYANNGDDGATFHDMGELAGASRFFYCAKASRSERNKGLEAFELQPPRYGASFSSSNKGSISDSKNPAQNDHPTVKPVSLMRYLVRLITPPGGLVVDPFSGSGTTGIACKVEKMLFKGIDKVLHHCEIARARIAAWENEAERKFAEDPQYTIQFE